MKRDYSCQAEIMKTEAKRILPTKEVKAIERKTKEQPQRIQFKIQIELSKSFEKKEGELEMIKKSRDRGDKGKTGNESEIEKDENSVISASVE